MSTATPTLWVAVEGDQAFVKVCGRASFACGPDFKRLIGELQSRGRSRFVFDLSECSLMDSTFLGIMAGFAMRAEEGHREKAVLHNPTPRILDLLDNLGVIHLFELRQGGGLPVGECQPAGSAAPPDKAEVTRASLDAHRDLIAIDPAKNLPRFKDVTRFLAEDLVRLERSSVAGT
jgi:anti-sigma B factor antagonist